MTSGRRRWRPGRLVLGLAALTVVLATAAAVLEHAAVRRPEGARVPASRSADPSATRTDTPTTTAAPTPRVVRAAADAIRIPALRLTSRLVATDIGAGDELSLPDLGVAGWYRRTTPPGSRLGSTLIASHSDAVTDGEDRTSPWLHLARLGPGDPVVVTWSHATLHYRVVRVVTVPAIGALPSWTVDPSSPARLVLVSCGGTLSNQASVTGMDDGRYHWSARVLVVARPA